MSTLKTYWNNDRHDDCPKMQARQDRISAEVPVEGSVDHPAVDCWREVQNIYYDLFNNGACNLVTTHSDWTDIEDCDEDQLDLDGLDYRMRAVEKFMGEDSWRCKQLRMQQFSVPATAKPFTTTTPQTGSWKIASTRS